MAPSADLCCLTRSPLRGRSLLLWALLSAARPETHITLPPQTRGSQRRWTGESGVRRAAPPRAALGDHGGPRRPVRRSSPAPLWPSTPASAAASLCPRPSLAGPERLEPEPRGPQPARLPRVSASSSPARRLALAPSSRSPSLAQFFLCCLPCQNTARVTCPNNSQPTARHFLPGGLRGWRPVVMATPREPRLDEGAWV